MPTFRTQPSGSLTAAVRRLVQSGGSNLGPLGEVQADAMAAQTAQRLSLADKARAEVEAMQRGAADRADPALAAEYAGNVAGLDVPTATRLSNHLRGVLEQPSPADVDDAMSIGREAQPYVTGAPDVAEPQKRLFQSALAGAIANRLATGKTNAAQLAQAGDRINETALTNQAANEPDLPTANRIVAAVAGKVRQPYATNAQGTVLNRETGDLNEGTQLADAVRALSGARTATEGARQTELGSRSTKNEALTGLADERAAAVARGEANKGGARVSPQQVERWVSEVARKEWDALPPRERKGMNYQQHLDKVRERFQPKTAQDEIADAHAAIAGGAPKDAVAKRFKDRMKFDLPEAVKVAAPAEQDDEEE